MFHLNNYIACEELSYDSSSSRDHHLRHIQDPMTYVVVYTIFYLLKHQGGVELKFKRKQTQFSSISWHTALKQSIKIHSNHHHTHKTRYNKPFYTTIKMHRRFLNIIFIYRTPPFAISPACVCVPSVHSVTKTQQQSTIGIVCFTPNNKKVTQYKSCR